MRKTFLRESLWYLFLRGFIFATEKLSARSYTEEPQLIFILGSCDGTSRAIIMEGDLGYLLVGIIVVRLFTEFPDHINFPLTIGLAGSVKDIMEPNLGFVEIFFIPRIPGIMSLCFTCNKAPVISSYIGPL